jgi:hypothetical protein
VSGESVNGVNITVVANSQTTSTTTDGHGFFQLDVPGTGNEINFDVIVAPRGAAPYTVTGLKAPTSSVRGDAHDLGIWVSEPYYNVTAELIRRCTPGAVIPNTAITFTRVSGPVLRGVLDANGAYHATSDENGHFPLFGPNVSADGVLPMKGIVAATLPTGRFVSGMTMPSTYLFRDFGELVQVLLAPESSYVGCLYDRAFVTPAVGIPVDFTRTGGTATGLQTYSTVSDSDGAFALKLQPLGAGPVMGSLTIHSPAPAHTYSIDTAAFSNVADPSGPAPPHFGVGLHLPYFGVINLPNVHIIAKRVGGIAASPDSVSMLSDGYGQFLLYLFKPKEAGDLIVDISFLPPAPYRSFILRGVHLSTLDRDSDAIRILNLDVNAQNGEPLGGNSSIAIRRP